jgi:rubrerythrin
MNDRTLEAHKRVILLHKRGQVLYRSLADNMESAALREVFTSMAEEETKYEHILAMHYTSLVSNGKLRAISVPGQVEGHTGEMLTEKARNEIEAAGYEAVAMSAAIASKRRRRDG